MILNDKTIPSHTPSSIALSITSSVPAVPHPLDVATLEQIPDLLKRFWTKHHDCDGYGYSQADLDAAARALDRLNDQQRMRDQARAGRWADRRYSKAQPGSYRVLGGTTLLLIGSSLQKPDDASSWLLSAGLVCAGLALVIWGVRDAGAHAVKPLGKSLGDPSSEPEGQVQQ